MALWLSRKAGENGLKYHPSAAAANENYEENENIEKLERNKILRGIKMAKKAKNESAASKAAKAYGGMAWQRGGNRLGEISKALGARKMAEAVGVKYDGEGVNNH